MNCTILSFITFRNISIKPKTCVLPSHSSHFSFCRNSNYSKTKSRGSILTQMRIHLKKNELYCTFFCSLGMFCSKFNRSVVHGCTVSTPAVKSQPKTCKHGGVSAEKLQRHGDGEEGVHGVI